MRLAAALAALLVAGCASSPYAGAYDAANHACAGQVDYLSATPACRSAIARLPWHSQICAIHGVASQACYQATAQVQAQHAAAQQAQAQRMMQAGQSLMWQNTLRDIAR